MALKELSDGGPDGTRLGQSASDLVSFHGATTKVQGVISAAVSTGVAVAISSGFGFSSSGAITQLMATVNSIRTILVDKGLGA